MVYMRLKTDHSISKDEMPYHLTSLSSTLESIFGTSAKVVEKAIAKRFYSSLGLNFSDHREKTLVDYVEEAKRKLQSRSES